jgi:hypothetical protein
MNAITPHHDDDDDGFSGSLVSGRLIKGQLVRWNETNGWMDRDGLRPPEIMLAIALSEALQCWKGKKPVETITAKPLPDVNDLNEAVPKSEWEPGLDGKPKPPWQHQVIVYLIDPTSGGFFTYLNSTTGARIAVDQLREKVITMRALRGARVVPVVRLTHRPMKTQFGMRNRPEFEVIEWRQWGGDGGAIAAPRAPQLSGPASAPTPKPTAAEQTITGMGTVKPVPPKEFIDDEIQW